MNFIVHWLSFAVMMVSILFNTIDASFIKDAPEAKVMHSICYGSPNLYFLFWAMGIHNLKSNAELVYIVPRSWTSGSYFKQFRQYLFSNCFFIL